MGNESSVTRHTVNEDTQHDARNAFQAFRLQRTTTMSQAMSAIQLLRTIDVYVKEKDGKWVQYSAAILDTKGSVSVDFMRDGDKYAVSILLQSISDLSVEKIRGGYGVVKIAQGNDPAHHKVTTFRFKTFQAAQSFHSTLRSYQEKEKQKALLRSSSSSSSLRTMKADADADADDDSSSSTFSTTSTATTTTTTTTTTQRRTMSSAEVEELLALRDKYLPRADSPRDGDDDDDADGADVSLPKKCDM